MVLVFVPVRCVMVLKTLGINYPAGFHTLSPTPLGAFFYGRTGVAEIILFHMDVKEAFVHGRLDMVSSCCV